VLLAAGVLVLADLLVPVLYEASAFHHGVAVNGSRIITYLIDDRGTVPPGKRFEPTSQPKHQ